ncbi:MAG: glutamate--tRNA ligase, partial [Myxococcota bacterium]
MTIRTRFAPSPTGYLHLGSARTALFNWAFARHHQGCLVLRIDDTDRVRSTPESERTVLQGLEWLGLEWDEGPFRQSERSARHAEQIQKLLAEDKAYRCVCTREELEERKLRSGGRRAYDGRCRDLGLEADCGPHTVRLRLDPDADLSWNDLVFGTSGQEAAQVGDMIIRRSDGTPLYNFAVVVDDIDMGITHVIRGADHQPNTPLQIGIYRALGAELPAFAHLPLIVGASGKKLSKRRDPVSIQEFETKGYLPQALRNWLVRIGWSHGDDVIFSSEEIISFFGLDAVGRSSAQADPDKLLWLNQHYIKNLPDEDLLAALDPFLVSLTGSPAPRSPAFTRLVGLLRERSQTLEAMAE